ncbi:GNAT family N-acetyltransferase [Lentilactobacillus kisonensis]|uniref:GNAT family N-acetyltransferase n=1 Tax=Lentilactobacillus kisonensis TaxID=481722 RepID=UPI000ACCEA86|nr:GNAT family N-acetyltransferase [Lentilactobacillus kisonensis]
MKFSVETINRNDYAAIRGIIADSYKNDAPNTDGDEVDMVDRLRSYTKYQSNFEIVAKGSDHRIVGHALMIPVQVSSSRHSFDVASIVEISVGSHYQNQGIGQAMVSELENRAQLAGYPAVSAIDNSDFFYKNNYVAADNFDIFFQRYQLI